MNLLLEPAPTFVEIGGAVYELDADFRNAIKFELLVLDENVPDEARGMLALRLFFPNIPPDTKAALEKIIWFYSCGEPPRKSTSGGGTTKRVYDYEQDGGYIYASFLAAYGIDLEAIPFLHWWKFKALFDSLPDDATICRIMGYRAANISKLKGEQKKFYQDMKRLYALRLPRDEREKLDEINEKLLRGEAI